MQTRMVVVATLVFALGCSRYEWRNELDTPGLCDGANQAAHATVSLRVSLIGGPLGSQLRGQVNRRDSREPLSGARVRLGNAVKRRVVESDSSGEFVIDSLLPGRYAIEVLRVGFHGLQDTVDVTRIDGGALEVRLDPFILDGPCSGFAAVRVRKPWWKVW